MACAKKTFFCRPGAEEVPAEVVAHTAPLHALDKRAAELLRYDPRRSQKGAKRVPVAIDSALHTEIVEKREAMDKRRRRGCAAGVAAPGGERKTTRFLRVVFVLSLVDFTLRRTFSRHPLCDTNRQPMLGRNHVVWERCFSSSFSCGPTVGE